MIKIRVMSFLIKKYIRYNRRNETSAESIFWRNARNRRFLGFRFNRQYPIKYEWDGIKRFFVADFYCAEKKLIVEIDGSSHKGKEAYDQFRTVIINQVRDTVIRLSNTLILSDIQTAFSKLEEAIHTPPLCCVSNREGAGG